MKKKLAHYFRASLTALAVSAPAVAADPPELRLPERLGPTVVKNFVKATAAVDPNLKLLNVEEAWEKTRGAGVILYVADTGIDAGHAEFRGLKVEAHNFTTDADGKDSNGHGTHCASTAAGQEQVDGVAPKVDRLVSLKVLANNGNGDFGWLAKAIRFAVKDANGKPAAFSASLGSAPSPNTAAGGFDADMQAAIKEGMAAGIVFVFAAGNDNSKFPPNSVGWPARYAEVPGPLADLAVVAACDLSRKITGFSSVGPATTVTVVGHDVLGALPDGQYGRWDGTSMATPQVAGLACLWLSANPTVPAADRQRQFSAALRKASSFPDNRHPARGYGLPDAGKLLASAPAPQPPKDRPFVVTIGLEDLSAAKQAELRAGGVDTFRLEIGHGIRPGGVRAVAPVPTYQPQQQPQPVFGQWVPPAQPWHPPVTYPAPMRMPAPQTCPPGGCGQVTPQQWYPGQRVAQWIR